MAGLSTRRTIPVPGSADDDRDSRIHPGLLLPHLRALALSKPQRAIVIEDVSRRLESSALSLGRFGIPTYDPHFGDRRGIVLGAVHCQSGNSFACRCRNQK